MLHQNRSKAIKKFKYLLMLPLILGMLVYTSCEQEIPESDSSAVEGLNPQLQKYYYEYKARVNSNDDLFDLTREVIARTPAGELMSEETFYRSNALLILKQEAFNESMGLSEGLNKELSRLGAQSYEDYLVMKKQQKKPVYTFTSIPEKPSFKTGCEDEQDAFECFKQHLDEHVRNSFRYPREAREQGIQGRVFMNFQINTDGSVTVLNTRAPHNLLDAEARRIIEALPELNPGKKADGTPVNISFVYPIVFKLGEGTDNDGLAEKTSGVRDVPFTVIPVKPSFKTPCEDGQSAFACFKQKLDAHVMNTFRYPEEARTGDIQGKAYVNFRINTDGSVTILNTRAPHESLDKEARRIIEALPAFNPGGDLDGNPVPVTFAYPIVFKL